MFLANLYVKSRQSPLQFFFTSSTSALEAGQKPDDSVKDGTFTVIDDYGQTGTFKSFDWAGWLVIDYEHAMRAEFSKQIITNQIREKMVEEMGAPRQ